MTDPQIKLFLLIFKTHAPRIAPGDTLSITLNARAELSYDDLIKLSVNEVLEKYQSQCVEFVKAEIERTKQTMSEITG